MLYKMNLANEPFISIKQGKKTIEMRLKSKGRENINQATKFFSLIEVVVNR